MALTNCLIIDGTGQPPQTGTILVVEGRIQAVQTPSAEIPQGYTLLDMEGRAVMPGFINAHVHNAHDASQLERWAKAGVTTVRDLNPRLPNFLATRDQLNSRLHTARLVCSTPMITVPGGYGSAYVNSIQAAKSMVESYSQEGVDVIKFALEDSLAGRTYPLLSAEMVHALTGTARAQGKRTSVHVSHVWNLPLVIQAEVTDIAHMVVEPLEEALVQQIVAQDIYWVPTLELWQGVSQKHGIPWGRVAVQNLNKFYEAGGKIALGTDFAGYSTSFDADFPITEVRLMKQAGMANMDIIIAATRHAAYVCHLEDELGTLEVGKIADILVVEGNPLEDIETLTRTHMVIKNGVVIFK